MDQFLSSADIGRKIKLFRQKAGLTQEKLAEILGVTFQQVQNYENGKNKLNTDKLQQVCQALNIPTSQLLSDAETNQYCLSLQEEQLIDSYRAIKNQDRKECLIIFAEALRKNNVKVKSG